MHSSAGRPSGKRRSINLTIREDVIEAAKSLSLNASQAAEAGIVEAIRQAQGAQWLRENQAGIKAHNQRIERDGPRIVSDWAKAYWPERD